MNAVLFLKNLKSTLTKGLPGVTAHSYFLPIKNLEKRDKAFLYKKEDHSYRDSAVSILLYPKFDNIYCVLIKRPTYVGKHSGQISFPGGKHELTDLNFEHTARREAFEEVGFTIRSKELLSPLTQLYIPVSNFLVHPYLFWTEKAPDFTADQREVESIIEFDVFDLFKPETLLVKDIQIENNIKLKGIPYYNIQNEVVWGATAMILSELKMILKDL